MPIEDSPIALAARDELPETWAALLANPNFGEEALERRLNTLMYRAFGTPMDEADQEALSPVLISYMNEIEYVLRIVLKARDELAGALRAAREQLRLFANAADSNKSKIDGFNDSIEKMNVNVSNITDKFKEWREVIQGTAGGNDKARKSFGDLGREVDSTNKATQRHAVGARHGAQGCQQAH